MRFSWFIVALVILCTEVFRSVRADLLAHPLTFVVPPGGKECLYDWLPVNSQVYFMYEVGTRAQQTRSRSVLGTRSPGQAVQVAAKGETTGVFRLLVVWARIRGLGSLSRRRALKDWNGGSSWLTVHNLCLQVSAGPDYSMDSYILDPMGQTLSSQEGGSDGELNALTKSEGEHAFCITYGSLGSGSPKEININVVVDGQGIGGTHRGAPREDKSIVLDELQTQVSA
jgi:hypothetical protein